MVESIHVNPAQALCRIFGDARIDVYADGLMSYGPTRTALPEMVASRMRAVAQAAPLAVVWNSSSIAISLTCSSSTDVRLRLMPLLPLEHVTTTVKTAIRPGNRHEWEAMIVIRRYRRYEIRSSRRAHIRGNPDLSNEIHVHPGSSCYALTFDGARRKAQRMVERLNRRDELDVPIARTLEVAQSR